MGSEPIDREVCEAIFDDLELRGDDACGLALVDNNKVTVKKTGIKASKALKRFDNLFDITPTTTMVLMHTRSATQGSTEIPANNHPIIGEQMVLIHNGIVNSSQRGYGASDSGQLLYAMEHHGIERAIANMSGWMAIAFLNYYRPNKLKLYHYTAPLDVAWDANREHFYFASDDSYMSSNWGRRFGQNLWGLFTGLECVTLDEEVLVTVVPAAGRVSMNRLRHKVRGSTTTYYHNGVKTTVADKLTEEDLELYDKLLQEAKPVRTMTDREWRVWHLVEDMLDPDLFGVANTCAYAQYSSYAAVIADPHLYTYVLPEDRERGLDPAFTKHKWTIKPASQKKQAKGAAVYLKGSGLYKADGTQIPTVSGAALPPASPDSTMAEAQALAAELERCDELS